MHGTSRYWFYCVELCQIILDKRLSLCPAFFFACSALTGSPRPCGQITAEQLRQVLHHRRHPLDWLLNRTLMPRKTALPPAGTRRVSLKMLAEHLDLSPATVSFVLNNAP